MKKKLLVVAIVMFAAGGAYAALIDNYDASYVAKVETTCAPPPGLCDVEITRVRPMNAASIVEANQLGIDTTPIVERIVKRKVTRANIATFITSTTAP